MNRCFLFIPNNPKTLRNPIRQALANAFMGISPLCGTHTTAYRSIIMPTMFHRQTLAGCFYSQYLFARKSMVMAYITERLTQ